MKKLFKLFLLGFGLLVILIIGAGVAITYLDPNNYKEFIITKVKEQTGRDLILGGAIKLEYYPWIDIEINDVTLGNAKGFGEQPFFHVDHLKLRVKTLPLLKKQINMDVLQVQGSMIYLAKNKQGITNWDDLVQGESKSEKSSPPRPLAAFMLGGLDIRNAGLIWDDQAANINYRVTDLNLSTGKLVLGEPIDLKMSLNAEASMPEISGDAALNGTIAYDLDAKHYIFQPMQFEAAIKGKNIPGGQAKLKLMSVIDVNLSTDTVSISDLVFDGLDTHADGNITAGKIKSGKPAVKGNLHIAGKDLAILFKAAEIEPLAGQLAKLEDRSFDISADFDADMEQGDAYLKGLTVNMLGAVIKGEVHAGDIHSKMPSFKGHFSAIGPDLPALIQVAGQFEPGIKPRIKPLGKHLTKIKRKDFNIATQFNVDLKTGNVNVPSLVIKALGINMECDLAARQIQSKTPAVKGSFKATGPDLPLLLELAGYFEQGENQTLGKLGRQLSKVGNKKFDMGTQFDIDMKQGLIHVPDIFAKSLGIVVAGKLNGSNIDQINGKINGRLSINGSNLPRLLKAVEQSELANVLKSVSADIGIRGNMKDLRLNPLRVKAVLSGKQIQKSPVKISLNAATKINLEKQTLKIDSFSLKGLGLKVNGNINAQQIINAPVFNGKLKTATFNLRKLLRQLNQKPPKTADKKVLKKVTLKTNFSGSKTDINFKKVNIVLDDTRIRGDFSVNEFANPDIRFDLNINKLDVDRYLPPSKKGKKKKKSKKTKKSKSKKRKATAKGTSDPKPSGLPMGTLRALKVKGDLLIGKLIISNARLEDVKIQLEAKNGNIKMAPMTANLYKGKYNGDILLDVTKRIPKITINSDLKGIQAEPLLNDVTGEAKLKGKGDFNAALKTKGHDAKTMKKKLNGKMSFSFKDGAIKGFNIGKFLRGLKAAKKNLSYKVSDKEETDFAILTGNPTVKKGMVRLNDLYGKSPGLRLHGKGLLADLIKEKINYDVDVTVVSTSKGQAGKDLAQLNGITIPIQIKGPLQDPKIKPDIKGALKSLATKEVIDKLGIEIPEIIDLIK